MPNRRKSFELAQHRRLMRALLAVLNTTWLCNYGTPFGPLWKRTSQILERTTQFKVNEYCEAYLLTRPVPPYPASVWDSVEDDGQLWALAEEWVHTWIQVYGDRFYGPEDDLVARLLAELLVSRGRIKVVEEAMPRQLAVRLGNHYPGRRWVWC